MQGIIHLYFCTMIIKLFSLTCRPFAHICHIWHILAIFMLIHLHVYAPYTPSLNWSVTATNRYSLYNSPWLVFFTFCSYIHTLYIFVHVCLVISSNCFHHAICRQSCESLVFCTFICISYFPHSRFHIHSKKMCI